MQVRLHFVLSDEVQRDASQCQLIGADNAVVDIRRVKQNAAKAFTTLPPENDLPGMYSKQIDLLSGDLFIRDLKTGERVEIIKTSATIYYEVVKQDVPYQYFHYSDTGSDAPLGSFAIAKGPIIDGKEVGFVFSSDKDGAVSLSIIAEEKK